MQARLCNYLNYFVFVKGYLCDYSHMTRPILMSWCLILCDISPVSAAPATTPLQCLLTGNKFATPLLERLRSIYNLFTNVHKHVNG